MPSKRFIFTIDDECRKHIIGVAEKNGISQSKAIQNIIKRDSINSVATKVGKTKDNKAELDINQIINKYSTPDLNTSFSDEDVTNLLSNEDIDLFVYILSDLIGKGETSDNLLLLYAKILKHRGYLSEAIEVLNQIDDNYNFQKYITLLSINISLGNMSIANDYYVKCLKLINIYNIQLAKYIDDLNILRAELLWIDKGVVEAHKFVNNIINGKQINNIDNYGKFYCLEGEFLRDKGDYVGAEKAYQNSLDYLRNISYEGIYLARSLKGLGSIYKKKGNLNLSSKMIFSALDLSRKFADKITESGVLASVSSLYIAKDNLTLGTKFLNEKSDIGQRSNSVRERFYANYDLCMVKLQQENHNAALKTINNFYNDAEAFKRSYYLDMWKGFIKSHSDFGAGIKMIESSRIEAMSASEDKKVYLADYLYLAASVISENLSNKSREISNSLLKNDKVSKQLKENVHFLLKSKKVKSI